MIPFGDLAREYDGIKEEIDEAVGRVLSRGWFVLGQEVEQFEAEFSSYIGCGHAAGVGSGTDALHLALRAIGVGPGDEVITVANSAFATACAIKLTGAAVRFVDVDPETGGMDVNLVESAIGKRTRAILPVHLSGHPIDMDPLLDLAGRHDIPVVEDACQAHGSLYKGKKVGSLGTIGCFSFYPSKNLGAYGDGGIATTRDPAIDDRLRMLRNYGQRVRYYHDEDGLNSRLDEIQAAILRVKLRHLDQWNARRRELAATYSHMLEGIDPDLILPVERGYARTNYHLYAIRHRRRDLLQAALRESGVGTQIHYPVPIHLQKGYRDGNTESPPSLPVTETSATEVLSLPMFPQLREDEVNQVVAAIRDFAGRTATPH